MIDLPTLAYLTLLVLVVGASTAVVWVVPTLVARRSRWSKAVRSTFVSLFHGPIAAAILTVGGLEFYDQFWALNPGLLPSVLSPAAASVIAELVVVWTAVGVAALAVRRHVLSDQARSGRLLQYGVYAAGLLAVTMILLSSPEVPHVVGGIWAVIGFGVGILTTYLVVHVTSIVLERYFAVLIRQRPHLETIYRFLRRAMLGIIALIGVMVSTYANFPVAAGAVTSLLLAAGFLSIVVGLAAQSTLSNIIAGAMVSLAQPFSIGDAVVFSGEWCFVEDVRLTFTVLRTWDLRRLMVPNSMFQSNVLINYSAVDPTMLVIVALRISYEADVDRARTIMLEEARAHPDFLPLGNLPVTHVMEYQENGIQLRLLSAAKDQPTAFQVEKDLLASVRKRYLEEGIEIPYATRRVIMDAAPRKGPGARSRKDPSS